MRAMTATPPADSHFDPENDGGVVILCRKMTVAMSFLDGQGSIRMFNLGY